MLGLLKGTDWEWGFAATVGDVAAAVVRHERATYSSTGELKYGIGESRAVGGRMVHVTVTADSAQVAAAAALAAARRMQLRAARPSATGVKCTKPKAF